MSNITVPIYVKVDTSSIEKAVGLALKSTKGRLGDVLFNAALYTAGRAMGNTPYVELAEIDSDLDKPVEVKSKKNKRSVQMTMGEAIVLARMSPNSRYNQLTDSRWAIKRPNFSPYGYLAKNVWRDYLGGVLDRMRATRHSSAHFLQSGWKEVIKQLNGMGRVAGGKAAINAMVVTNPLNRLNTDELGAATRGGEGTATQWITIENKIGEGGYPHLDAERNAALMAYGTPALERGMNEQAQWLRDHYLPKAGAELAAEWESIPNAAPMRAASRVSSVRMAEVQSVAEVNLDY